MKMESEFGVISEQMFAGVNPDATFNAKESRY